MSTSFAVRSGGRISGRGLALVFVLGVSAWTGCGDDADITSDAGSRDGGGRLDGAPADGTLRDGGSPDAGARDGAALDAGAEDGSAPIDGSLDAGTDGGVSDAGVDASFDGAPALCAARTGGALIMFRVVDETLTVWIENDTFIDEAIAAEGESAGNPVFNTLLDGTDCDPQWTWHPDPNDVSFADFTTEVCDGLPSHVEDDKTYWFNTVTRYCPWGPEVVSVDDRR